MLFALIDRWSWVIRDLAPERILHRYEDLLLVRCADAEDPVAQGALESIPADLPVRVNGQRVVVPAGGFEPVRTPRAVVRFFGPVAPEWEERLQALGARIHFRCPRFGLCVQLPDAPDAQAFRAELPALAGWVPYDFRLCRRPLSATASPLAPPGVAMPGWTDIVCFSEEDRAGVARELAARGIPVLDQSRYKLRALARAGLDALRRVRGVKLADGARAPILAGVELDAAVGLEPAPLHSGSPGLDGEGEVIAVADTGLDRGHAQDPLHPDFRGRVRALESWPLNPSWDAYVVQSGSDDGGADVNSGHGTHVAGLALGDGSRSGGRYRGLAPGAQLVFQAIEQRTEVRPEHRARVPSGYYLNGRPLDLRDLFEQARALGARIHVNAWGDPADGQYTDDCFEADLFLWRHPDAVVLFAAGNAGAARSRGLSLDPGSLYAPASAKNVVAIGATEGPRAGVGFRGTWSGFDRDGQRFPNPALAGRTVSGAHERIALFSSTGPTRDGRIKPDLCAPGTNLAAPKSQASAARGWGLASPLPHYMYYGGTSMATGVAGGCVALLRQAWSRELGAAPSGPALKALLVHGARAIVAHDGSSAEPRHVAGFGRLELGGCLPGHDGAPILIDRSVHGVTTGTTLELTLPLAAGQWFSAALAWYDYPGETLVNDLDLCLSGPAGMVVWGNHEPGFPGQPDRVNTVERISLRVGVAGIYRLRVIAVNVPNGPQGFALVHSRGTAGAAGGVPERPGLPAEWIKGIGETYAERLGAAGVIDLRTLLALAGHRLGEVLQARGARLQRLEDRLSRLRGLAAGDLASAPADLTLWDLQNHRRPDTLGEADWGALRVATEPLADVFDKDVLTRVRVLDLHRLAIANGNRQEDSDA